MEERIDTLFWYIFCLKIRRKEVMKKKTKRVIVAPDTRQNNFNNKF